MPSSYNNWQLIGRLGRDPEARFTKDGKMVCTFSIACDRASGSGEQRKETVDWFQVVCFEKLAENVNQYLTKGRLVFVEGRCQISTWEKNDGSKGYRTECVAHRVLFLGGQKDGDREASREDELTSSVPGPRTREDDDNLPF